jgi:hypothetical protein
MKRVVILALPLLLSGCGLSSTAIVASAVVEGTSVATTGKTVSDYAISEITDRDCTLLHGITRGHVCQDPPDAERNPEAVIAATAEPAAAEDAAPQGPAGPDSVLSKRPGQYQPAWTLVLTVVEDYGQAVSAAGRLQPKPGLITAASVDGKVVYRVTTEPFSFDEAADRQRQAASQNFANAVLSAVCPYWMQDDSCIVLDRTLPL